MFIFFVIFFAVIGLFAAYITWRLFSHINLSRMSRSFVAVGIIALVFLTPLNILLRRSGYENAFVDALAWWGFLGLGFLSFLFTFLLLRDFSWAAIAFLKKICSVLFVYIKRPLRIGQPENPARRDLLIKGMNCAICGCAALFSVYGFAEAQSLPRVKRVKVRIGNLPEDFAGFRIAQITDLHISPTIKRPFVEAVVKVVNSLNADIIAMTGDLVDGTVEQLYRDVAPLEDLKSAEGSFFVTGNHEYYSGVIPWLEKINQIGFTVLLNNHFVIKKGSSSMLLAGVTDFRGGDFRKDHISDPIKAVKGAPYADVKILLAHQPKSIFEAQKAGFDFQISGHTHGGQFFPWNFVINFVQPFISGLHDYKGTQIYVSNGTGYWGPPLRVGPASEITLIELWG